MVATDLGPPQRLEETQRRAAIQADRCRLWTLCWPSLAVIGVSSACLVYMHRYALKTGLDATTGSYRRYWYSLLAVEVLVITPVLFVILLRLARTRCQVCSALEPGSPVPPDHELRHIWTHFSLLLAAGLTPNLLIGLFAAHDGAWHQAVLRDTSLAPTHIPMFFGLGPMAIGMTAAAFLYGRTRIPAVWGDRDSIPLAYVLSGGAWVVTMLFFSLNEFGHTQWIPEERLTNAVHFPFLIAFWGAVALMAAVIPSAARAVELMAAQDDPAAGAAESRA